MGCRGFPVETQELRPHSHLLVLVCIHLPLPMDSLILCVTPSSVHIPLLKPSLVSLCFICCITRSSVPIHPPTHLPGSKFSFQPIYSFLSIGFCIILSIYPFMQPASCSPVISLPFHLYDILTIQPSCLFHSLFIWIRSPAGLS